MAPGEPRVPIGDNLARFRRDRNLTQEALAERARVSVDLVKKLEQHQRTSARLASLQALARALRVTVADLTEPRPPKPAAAHPATPAPPTAAAGLTVADLAGIRQTIAHLVALDTAFGSTGLDDIGVRAFTDARTRLATATCPAHLAGEVADAVAELGQVAAWLLHDADRHDDARTTLAEALVVASTAGADTRRAELMILDQLSMLATWSGRWAEALRYADRGLVLAGGASPRVEAMYRIRRGRALALGGHPDGLDELHRAAALLADTTRRGDPPWTWWVTPAEVTVHQALAASDLGHHDQALDLARQACHDLDAAQRRDAVIYRVVLLKAAVAAGAWHDATDTATALAATLPHAGSARAVGMVRVIAANLPAAAPTTVATAVRAVLAAAGDTTHP